MIRAYLSCNSISLVTRSVGQHKHQFIKEGNQLKKNFFELTSMKDSSGMDGSITGKV